MTEPGTDRPRGDQLGVLTDVLRSVAAWRVGQGLTAHQAEVLIHVLDAGATSAADLRRRVGISTASMSRLLEQVELNDWVVRVPDPRDARRVLVQPSKKLAAESAHVTSIGASATVRSGSGAPVTSVGRRVGTVRSAS